MGVEVILYRTRVSVNGVDIGEARNVKIVDGEIVSFEVRASVGDSVEEYIEARSRLVLETME